jgi:hypothetical protein
MNMKVLGCLGILATAAAGIAYVQPEQAVQPQLLQADYRATVVDASEVLGEYVFFQDNNGVSSWAKVQEGACPNRPQAGDTLVIVVGDSPIPQARCS